MPAEPPNSLRPNGIGVRVVLVRAPASLDAKLLAMTVEIDLERAAAAVRADLDLDTLLGKLGEAHLVGSAALGLMVWPDVDLTVVCDRLDVVALHHAAAALIAHPRVRQVTVRNDTGHWNTELESYPDGVYWGVDYRDEHRTWNIDIWFVTDAGRQPDLRHLVQLRARLTPETRSAIMAIKASLVRSSRVSKVGDLARHLHRRARLRRTNTSGVRSSPAALTD
jgi:hypothetical protein